MSILAPDKIRSLGYVTNAKAHSRSKVDLQRVGQDIYDVLNQKPHRKGYKARQRERHVVLDPNKHYRVADVSALLNISYDKALSPDAQDQRC